jgi:hypothetical protein
MQVAKRGPPPFVLAAVALAIGCVRSDSAGASSPAFALISVDPPAG